MPLATDPTSPPISPRAIALTYTIAPTIDRTGPRRHASISHCLHLLLLLGCRHSNVVRFQKKPPVRHCAQPLNRFQLARLQPLKRWAGRLQQLPANASGNASDGAAGGANPVDRSTAPYQCWPQTPSVARRPVGHCNIASVHGISSAAQRARIIPAGSARTSSASITGGCVAGGATISSITSSICGTPISSRLRRRAFGIETRDHALRRADQNGVTHLAEPSAWYAVDHVVRHVLLIPNRRTGRGQGQLNGRSTASRVGFMPCQNDLILHGVNYI